MMLINAIIPNAKIIAPEMRLIQIIDFSPILLRKYPVRPLSMNHQIPDPRKMPITMIDAAK
jgi:hypothetical protein